jgi:glucose-6-phosphate dehydrogenase assembly protein OpcA
VGGWLAGRLKIPLLVSVGTRRCVAEFAGFPRQLFLDGDVTADGCVPVQWRVWHLCMREDAAFAVADWESALAMAAEPVS